MHTILTDSDNSDYTGPVSLCSMCSLLHSAHIFVLVALKLFSRLMVLLHFDYNIKVFNKQLSTRDQMYVTKIKNSHNTRYLKATKVFFNCSDIITYRSDIITYRIL